MVQGLKKKFIVFYYSGAGKTVSAKYIMRYFATADDQESQGKKQKLGMTEVEEQILGKVVYSTLDKLDGLNFYFLI